MQAWTYGIWFIGAGVWLLAAALSLRLHNPARTLGAMVVALVFLLVGMLFAKMAKQSRR